MESLRLSSAGAYSGRCQSARPMSRTYTYAMKATEDSFTPGVGSFEVARAFSATSFRPRSASFSLKSRHPEQQGNMLVGPGSYNPFASALNHGSYMAQARRRSATATSNTPNVVGPAGYCPEKSREGVRLDRGFTLSARYLNLNRYDTPGVGAYNIDKPQGRRPITMEGRHAKFQNMYMQTANNPGVGAYTIDVAAADRARAGFSFPHNFVKLAVNSSTPGVGAYTLKMSNVRSGAGAGSMGGRHKGNHF